MSTSEPVIIAGQRIGRFKASWLLFKESWRYLRADSEMLWIPLITAALNLLLFGILVGIFYFVALGGEYTPTAEGESASPLEIAFYFGAYVIGAFTLALSQAAIVHTVYTRVHGGDATLGQALKAAFSHWLSLLGWSLITSTVGVVLRMIAERSALLGRILVAVVGVAWSVLTYFVVPAMVIDKKSSFASIKKSGEVFRSTWGETIISNVTLGLVFLVAHIIAVLALIGLSIIAGVAEMPSLPFILTGLFILWIVVASLVQATLEGVIKTLLYIYASEKVYPPNFNQELLEKMMSRKKPDAMPFAANQPVVPPLV
jgi:hypothetical protein